MNTLRAILWLSICVLFSCDPADQKQIAAKVAITAKPHRDTLRQNFWQRRQLTIIYAPGMDTIASQLTEKLRSFETRLIEARQASPEDTQGSLFLIGTPESNPWMARIQARPALSFRNGQLVLNGTLTPKNSTTFISFYPNPRSPKHPVFIAASCNASSLKHILQLRLEQGFSAFGWGGWQYEVFTGRYRMKCGKYHPATWAPVAEQELPPPDSMLPLRLSDYFNIHWHGGTTDTASFYSVAKACQRQAEAVLLFCGKTSAEETPDLHLFPSMEAKGMRLGNTLPVQVSYSPQRADAIADTIYNKYWLGPQNELLLRNLLGRPQMPILESGLALTFNPEWQRYGFRYWSQHLNNAGLLPEPADLEPFCLNDNNSPLIRQVAAAAFCDFLIHLWGKTTFLEHYARWQPGQQELMDMAPLWQQYLGQHTRTQRIKPPKLPYLKGFNFAHEGYSIYNGYGSKLAAEMVDEQARTGANALAIVPYSYMRSPKEPTPLPIMSRAGTENDESVIRDLRYARQRGLKTVLKPQIWLGGGHWPGDIQMQSEADWSAFFGHYTTWIAHYALIAEIYDADLFCVGVEFAKATLERPEDWRKLIAVVRSVYRGPITYAANWGAEFEKIVFWPDLDLIGLNCYYPLSEKSDPSQEELSKNFSEVLQKARSVSTSYRRPLLLTEIGFTSTTTPWLQPHHDGDGGTYSGLAQLRCYEVVTRAIAAETDWCKGILWWKYPSYPSRGGEGHTGFTPNNKPAEKQLPALFMQLPR